MIDPTMIKDSRSPSPPQLIEFIRMSRSTRSTHFYPLCAAILCFSLFSTACSLIYRLPTRQGNEISQEKVDQLQLGLNREQVKFLMGTPLTENPFRDNQWDYAWFYKNPRGKESRRVLSLTFVGDRLTNIDDNLAEKAAEIDIYELEEAEPLRDRSPISISGGDDSGQRQTPRY